DDAQVTTPDDQVVEVTNKELEQKEKTTKQLNLKQTDKNNSQYRQAQRILKSSSAYDMANILRDVIEHGTGRAALKIGRSDLGGKTGTTNPAIRVWFAAFCPKLVFLLKIGRAPRSTLGR
ncbi:hypothetical protein RZN38_29760, partial [Klebsiella pneumoniae]|nr:hypothetical protein [Klebsiella pneumoniae]